MSSPFCRDLLSLVCRPIDPPSDGRSPKMPSSLCFKFVSAHMCAGVVITNSSQGTGWGRKFVLYSSHVIYHVTTVLLFLVNTVIITVVASSR